MDTSVLRDILGEYKIINIKREKENPVRLYAANKGEIVIIDLYPEEKRVHVVAKITLDDVLKIIDGIFRETMK